LKDENAFVALEPLVQILIKYHKIFLNNNRMNTFKKGNNDYTVSDVIKLFMKEPLVERYDNEIKIITSKKNELRNVIEKIIVDTNFFQLTSGLNIFSEDDSFTSAIESSIDISNIKNKLNIGGFGLLCG
jgi:hypothetical protein